MAVRPQGGKPRGIDGWPWVAFSSFFWFRALLVAVGLFALPPSLAAEVTALGNDGFSVKHSVQTKQSATQVYQALLAIDKWWHPDHSWSTRAENLYIKAELGGCFCERLPADSAGGEGGVEHLRIFYLKPNQEIRFDGSLGPLSGMAVQGRMIWKIENPEPVNTTVTFSYSIHGFNEGGFEGIAAAVDGVIGQQLQRFAASLAD